MDKAEKIANSSTMMAATVKASENSSTGFPFSGDFDLMVNWDHYSGFMELLGVSDFSPFPDFARSDLHEMMFAKSPSLSPVFSSGEGMELPETSLTIPPPMPYSSISTSSSERDGDESNCKGQQPAAEKDKQKKSSLKPRKKGIKREREPRFAFMTKSDVDHLEDGYRWRKYGQKAVKNSPFPRSYYRCTSTKCGVKKRVERSCQDPTIVITTYEGQHTHQSPAVSRPAPRIQLSSHASPATTPSSFLSFPHARAQQPSAGLLAMDSHAPLSPQVAVPASQQLVPTPHVPTLPPLPRDDGLLQDMLPSGVRE